VTELTISLVHRAYLDDRTTMERSGVDFLIFATWSEPSLFDVAYGYEQATLHRRSPKDFPPLSL